MDKKRVVVTGVGAVASPGIGIDDLWKGLQDPPGPAPRLIANWDPEPWLPKRESRRLDKFTQFALVAAHEAFAQSGELDVDPNRVTVSMATGIGGLESLEILIHAADEETPRASPFSIPMMMANAAAAAISIKYGFGGQVTTPVVACAAGSQSIVGWSSTASMGLCRCSRRRWDRGGGHVTRPVQVSRLLGRCPNLDSPCHSMRIVMVS